MCQVITLLKVPKGKGISLLMTHIVDYMQLHIKQNLRYKLHVITYNPYSHKLQVSTTKGTIIVHKTTIGPLVEGYIMNHYVLLKVHFVHSPRLVLNPPFLAGF